MRILGLIISAAVATVVAVLVATAVNMAAAEFQARLDGLCFLLLRLARRRVPPDLRAALHDEEWLPELHHILRRDEARPITRVVQGLAFSLGLLLKTRSVTTEVGDSRSTPQLTHNLAHEQAHEKFDRFYMSDSVEAEIMDDNPLDPDNARRGYGPPVPPPATASAPARASKDPEFEQKLKDYQRSILEHERRAAVKRQREAKR